MDVARAIDIMKEAGIDKVGLITANARGRAVKRFGVFVAGL